MLKRMLAAGALLAGMGIGAALCAPSEADAKASYESSYGYARTWNAALRLVRVDLGLKVTEKDEESGYILFEYTAPDTGGKITPGSLEMVRGHDADDPVHVIVQLPQMPHYHEQLMADELAAKMRAEYGDPPARKRPPPDAGAPDAAPPAPPPQQPQLPYPLPAPTE